MKTIILLLLVAMSSQLFSQSGFSKRKYRKGIFIEKITRLKQTKAAERTSHDTALARQTMIAEKKAPTNADTISIRKQDTVAVAGTYQKSDSVLQARYPAKAYESIAKHNTLKLSGEDIYCFNSRRLVIRAEHQVLWRKSETKALSGRIHSRYASMLEDLAEGLKNIALWICIIILAIYLVASILTIIAAPVASLSWGVAIALGVYAVIGIIICAMYLADAPIGKFMEYVTAIFAIVSLVVLYGSASIGDMMNSYRK